MTTEDRKGKIIKSETDWKKELTQEQYHVLRRKGTERPFSGKYVCTKEIGIYLCAGCGNELFPSKTKYDSGSGWPSFGETISEENVETEEDRSFLMKRTGVKCQRCGGHLGHVFRDGPKPTGMRYCVNSAALKFKATGQKSEHEPHS